MSADDLIAAYVVELARRLGPSSRSRELLAEAEDHLREATAAGEAEGCSPEEAAVRAIARFGGAWEAAGLLGGGRQARQTSRRGLALLVGAFCVGLGALAGWGSHVHWSAAASTSAGATRRAALPASVVRTLTANHDPVPAGRTVALSRTATANGDTSVLAAFTRQGRVCQVTYFARPGSLARDPAYGFPGVDCQAAGRYDFRRFLPLSGGSALRGAFLLSGLVPQETTSVVVIDSSGGAHRVDVGSEPAVATTPRSKPFLVDVARVVGRRQGVAAVQLLRDGQVIGTMSYCCGG